MVFLKKRKEGIKPVSWQKYIHMRTIWDLVNNDRLIIFEWIILSEYFFGELPQYAVKTKIGLTALQHPVKTSLKRLTQV